MERYFTFNGNYTRSDFWGIQILSCIILFITFIVEFSFASIFSESVQPFISAILVLPTVFAYGYVFFATIANRLRNANINPWFSLCVLIPYFGTIVFIIFGCIPTDKNS